MKLKAAPVLHIASLFLLIYSCSSVKVVSTCDEEADFSKYKSIEYLGWSEGSEELVNQEDMDRIVQSVGNEFRNRSFEIMTEGADLQLSMFLVLNLETITADYIAHHNGYYGIGALGPSAKLPEEDYNYTVGTLIIDIFDADTELLVWQGIGTKTVVENPEKREKSIPKSISKIMNKFPVNP